MDDSLSDRKASGKRPELPALRGATPVSEQRRLTGRFRMFGRSSAMLLSCVLMGAFVWLGVAIVPRPGLDRPQFYISPHAHAFRRDQLPVFIMREDRSVVRHGTASVQGPDRFAVNLFASSPSRSDVERDAILFETGLTALWAAVSDESQEELRRQIAQLQEEGASTVTRLVTSEVFITDYRPRLSAILAQSVSEAWEEPQSQAAFEAFLRDSDPAFRNLLENGVRDLIVDGLGRALWELARTNWTNVLRIPFGHEIDVSPVLEEVKGLLRNPDFRRTLVGFGRERLTSPGMRVLLERVTVGSIDAMLKNPEFPLLMAEMMGDERLRSMLGPFGHSAARLASSLPRLLGGLGGEASLNPLAAHVFRAFALGTESPLILYVRPEERRRIQSIEGDIAILLSRSPV